MSSWDELSECFLIFWGGNKSWDQYLSKFHTMQRQRDETISIFNRIFSSFYYKIPKEIQPSEATTRICYAIAFHSDITCILMAKRSSTFQQMFDDAREIEENLQACQKLPK